MNICDTDTNSISTVMQSHFVNLWLFSYIC